MAVLNNDVLEFPSEKILDQRLVFGVNFQEIGEHAERFPIEAANGIKELLDGFCAIRALDSEITNGLKPVANTLFVRLRFRCSLDGGRMIQLVMRMRFFRLGQA